MYDETLVKDIEGPSMMSSAIGNRHDTVTQSLHFVRWLDFMYVSHSTFRLHGGKARPH
jgi:hypothetical protein